MPAAVRPTICTNPVYHTHETTLVTTTIEPSMPLNLRYMTVADIPTVVRLDALSFPLPWPERSYLFEITENTSSHMIVLEAEDQSLIGYAGMWLIIDEAHISTIAVHPEQRGHGYGEILLTGLLRQAQRVRAEYAMLEVRVSNEPAISLYHKYGFDVVNERRNYYRDNGENAYLMTLSHMTDITYARLFSENLAKLHERVAFTTQLDAGKPT